MISAREHMHDGSARVPGEPRVARDWTEDGRCIRA
jgi:hypothetical protein